MATVVEPLTGGLVTSRDPALLKEGELSDIVNAHYFPNTQALKRATGRASFGTVSAGVSAVGLRDAKFDNGDHYLLAHASASYFRAAVGDGPAATFTSFFSSANAATAETPVTGASLETIQRQNRFFLLNGTNINQVFYLSATATSSTPLVRRMGLRAVSATPATAEVASAFSQSASGYYEYWTTEMFRGTADGAGFQIEGTFVSADPATVFVSSTGVAPRISMPATVNPNATHWRIYRSPRKETATDVQFPAGFLAATLPVTTNTFLDGSGVSNTGLLLVASANSGGNLYAEFASATGATTDDAGATFARANIDLSGSSTFWGIKYQAYYAIPFTGISGNIAGIDVQVRAKASSATKCSLSVAIGEGRGANGEFVGGMPQKSTGALTTSFANYTLGSSSDKWFPSSSPEQFTESSFNSNFMILLIAQANRKVTDAQQTETVDIDFVKIRVHYAGAAAANEKDVPFGAVTIDVSGVVASVGRDGEPPRASTGDVYEDSVVVNDTTNRSLVRYSSPGLPESFPSLYFIDFETPDNDEVTLIRTLNNRLLVGLRRSLWRINYLPNENDSQFSRGRAIENVSSQFGPVNAMCGAIYTKEGGRQELAFVSDQGIMTTDGFKVDTLTRDLDWRLVVATANSTPIALINDPENWTLWFYYRNDGLGTDSYRKLPLSYHPRHLKEEGPKIGGPVFVRNKSGANFASVESAWAVSRSNGDTSIYTGYGGSSAAGGGDIYLDQGTTNPANDPAFGFTTRRMYLNGLGNEWKLTGIMPYFSSQAGSQTHSWTAKTVETNDTAGEVSRESLSATLAGQITYDLTFNQIGEGTRLTMAVTSGHNTLGMESILIEGEGFDTRTPFR